MSLAKNIKKYRRKNHLSQDALADACCVARCTISNWETGRRIPNYDSILLLAKLFGITIDELLKPENESTPLLEENNTSDNGINETAEEIHTETIEKRPNEIILLLSTTKLRRFKLYSAIVLTIVILMMAVGMPAMYFISKYKQEPLCLENVESVSLRLLDLTEDNIIYFESNTENERKNKNVEQNSVEIKFIIRDLDLSKEKFVKYWLMQPENIKFYIIIDFYTGSKETITKAYRQENIFLDNNLLHKSKDYLYLSEFGIYNIMIILRSGSCSIAAELEE